MKADANADANADAETNRIHPENNNWQLYFERCIGIQIVWHLGGDPERIF